MEEKLMIVVDWSQILSVIISIISVSGGALFFLYRKISKRLIFIESWNSGLELVLARKDGNGIAEEIRQAQKDKLNEWKFKNSKE